MTKGNRSNGAKETDAAGAALRVRARESGEAALKVLNALLASDSDSVKLAAIKELLDRGFGRPGQSDPAGGVLMHVLIEDGYED
jgi:hypothetical protein